MSGADPEVGRPRRLPTPFDPAELAELRSGDAVLISGEVLTARDAAHERFARAIAAGEPLPVDVAGATIYFVGPKSVRFRPVRGMDTRFRTNRQTNGETARLDEFETVGTAEFGAPCHFMVLYGVGQDNVV